MLKFVLGAFLFMGLAVNAQFSEDQSASASEAVDMDNKAQTEQLSSNSESEANVDFSEESEEDDYSAATEKETVSADDDNFDKDDEYRAQVLDESKDDEECDDESGARCWRPRCSNFLRARNNFRRWKGRCYGCLRSRAGYCKRVCTIFRRRRAGRYRYCRKVVYKKMTGFRIAFIANWKKIVNANKNLQQNLAAYRWYAKRTRGYNLKKALALRLQQRKIYRKFVKKHNNNLKKRNIAISNANAVRREIFRVRRSRLNAQVKAKKIQRLIRKKNNYYAKARYFERKRRANYNTLKAAAGAWHKFNRIVIFLKRKNQYKKNFIAWLKVKRQLLAKRRGLIIRARRYYKKVLYKCMSAVKGFFLRCRFCNAVCGRNCNFMQFFYARAIVFAHQCRMQKSLCGRKVFFKRRYFAWRRACFICRKNTRPKLKLLLCSARCQTRNKYAMLWNFYKKKC